MNFTVNQRVAGGFGLLALLLIIMSVTSFNSFNKIDNQLSTVTEEATPLVVASQKIIADLLGTGIDLSTYHNSRKTKELNTLEAKYQKFIKKYYSDQKRLASLSSHQPMVLNAVNKAKNDYDPYIKNVKNLFEYHSLSVKADSDIDDMLSTFEDTADELDAGLLDLADSHNGQTKKSIENLNSMVQEATVNVTDGLQIDNLQSLQTSINELQSLEQSINEAYAKLNGKVSLSDISSAMETFKSHIGINGVLQMHKTRLQNNEKSLAVWKKMATTLQKTVASLNKVSEQATNIANKAKETAGSTVTFSLTLISILAIVAIAIAVSIGFWVSQSIRKPLAVIADVLAKVSAGDMTQNINITSQDEFGQLGQWINDLVVKLRGMLGEISSNSQQLSSAAEETSAITEQTRVGVEQQKDQINQIATAMSQMAATVEDVASRANDTMNEVTSAKNESSHGSEVVQQTRETIIHLSGEINRAGGVITKLDEHSSNIGAILDVIRGIADQTNLLALNAAIEAARAGEHGRGFSVVADEVRSLASKTQESTADIQHMIEELQQGTQEAVSVMEMSQQEANACVEQSDTASNALNEIANAIQAINDMSAHIAHAAKEQNTVTQEMHRNIEAISEISEQTALGAAQTSDASHEQSNLANQLQGLVNQFHT